MVIVNVFNCNLRITTWMIVDNGYNQICFVTSHSKIIKHKREEGIEKKVSLTQKTNMDEVKADMSVNRRTEAKI